MHVTQSSLTLVAPQNESTITLIVSGENERMTEIIHDMCQRAVSHAVEPLDEPAVLKFLHARAAQP